MDGKVNADVANTLKGTRLEKRNTKTKLLHKKIPKGKGMQGAKTRKKLQQKRRSNGRKLLHRILRQYLRQKRKLKRRKGKKETSAEINTEGAGEGNKIEETTKDDINVRKYVEEERKKIFINKIVNTTLKVKIKKRQLPYTYIPTIGSSCRLYN